MGKEEPFVSIITVNYNGKRFLEACFESLSNLNYPKDKLEIFMVDNGSNDDSIDYVKNCFPNVKIIVNNENNYAKANNAGIKAAKGEYIALINNDVKVDKNWLIELVKIAEFDMNIAGVGSKILFNDGKINSSGHMQLPNYYWADRGFQEEDLGQYDLVEEVCSITGAACLFRRKYLEDIGFFDEDFHMFIEDVDLSIRLKKQGWKIFYCPHSIAFHEFHGTAEEDLVSFYVERNRLLFIAKHFPDKLGEGLLGNGYFIETNNPGRCKDIYKILPMVIIKIIQYHNKEKINKVLFSLFDSLDQILNLEKYKLVQMLGNERNNVISKDKSLAQKDALLQQRTNELEQRDKDVMQKDALLQQLDNQLNQ